MRYNFESLVVDLLLLFCIICWLAHIFKCFSEDLFGFLIAGAIFFPVGILHGFYLILL